MKITPWMMVVVLGCGSSAGKDPSTFTLGSTKDEVRAVMGAPTSVEPDQFEYEFSIVSFRDGRVVGWWDRSTRLRIRIDPRDPTAAAAARARGTFTIGATKDEVFGAQGVPTEVDAHFDEWQYDFSIVRFADGKVTGYDERGTTLHVR